MFLRGLVVGQESLTNNSPLQGRWVSNSDGTQCLAVRLYNGTGGTINKGECYRVAFDGDEETNPKAANVVTLANVYQYVVVALADLADAVWGDFAIQGYCDAMCNGDSTDISKDDFLTVNDSTDDDAFIGDTTTRTVNSMAIACAAETDSTPSLTRVYLLGDRAIIP